MTDYNAVKHYYIIGGGTMVDIAPHLSLCAPAFGKIAKQIAHYLQLNKQFSGLNNIHLVYTQMADANQSFLENNSHVAALFKEANISKIRTNNDLESFIDVLVSREDTKCIILTSAVVDFAVDSIWENPDNIWISQGPSSKRLSSSVEYGITLCPTQKIIKLIRRNRKDIFLVGFKTTVNETRQVQYEKGLKLLKEASCNLVVTNDLKTKNNFIITPEEAIYAETTDRDRLAEILSKMIYYRSQLTFTKSTVVNGFPIPWNSNLIPSSLSTIVNHLITRKAYKPFLGKTVGHFACKLNSTTFLTSIRKTNFNDIDKNGLVLVTTDSPDSVIAFGAKPSVGGQSQRIIFQQHPDLDCIVHAHVPRKANSLVPIVSQFEYECGSHECGQNTSNGLKQFDNNIWAVMLDKHGPNIVFPKNIEPQLVIDFIEANFDLEGKTE